MSVHDNAHGDLSPYSPRPHSIDLTLELERQLDNDSIPPSSPNRPQSLDTNVLASIVTQLRMSLAEVTKDRDSLAEKLAEAHSREEEMKAALQNVTEKCIRLETDLSVAADQHKDDEDAIAMLRSKVEESRRGLMRLQTESRRMSQMSNLSLDLSRTTQSSYSGPPSSKRASFAPLTGSSVGVMGHRRVSSVSDSGLVLTGQIIGDQGQWPSSPRFPDSSDITPTVRSMPHNSVHSRRMSSMFYASSGSSDPASSLDASRIDALRKELEGVKEQLEETKGELYESQEAHEASELCVKALRTFISENNVGLPMSHNPSGRTSSMSSASEEGKKYGSASRWGFKLWSSTDVQTNITALPVSTDRSASEPATTQTVSSKLGGFFGTRTSISSTSSSSRPPVRPIHQEPMYNGSDTSSIADSATEPVSPEPEVPRTSVLVNGEELLPGDDDGEVMKSSHSPTPPS